MRVCRRKDGTGGVREKKRRVALFEWVPQKGKGWNENGLERGRMGEWEEGKEEEERRRRERWKGPKCGGDGTEDKRNLKGMGGRIREGE